MTIKEAKNKKIIPEEFNFIPDICSVCGSDLNINENLTIMECSNIYCLESVIYRAEQMLKNFNIVGVGTQFCRKFFNLFPSNHHTTILLASLDKLISAGGEAQGTSIYKQILNIVRQVWTFDDLVSKLALPNLNQEAYKIFKGIYGWKTFKLAVEQVSGNMENYLFNLEGFGEIKSKSIAKTFELFDIDLIIVDMLFKKYLGKRKSYNICITGFTNYYNMTKTEYIDYLKKISNGIISIVQKSSFTSDCDYLIASNKYANLPSNMLSIKHNQALARERRTGQMCILTAEEFVNLILKEREQLNGETN